MRPLPRSASCRRLLLGALLACLPLAHGHAAESEITRYESTPTLWSLGNASLDTAPVIASAAKQVYRLVAQSNGSAKVGTGFLVSGSRVIATNHHVVDKGSVFSVGFSGEDGRARWVSLQILAVFPQKDLAILQAAEDLPGEPLPLAAEYPELASDLYAIGFPAAADPAGEVGAAQATDPNFVLPSVLKGNVSRIMTGTWITNQLQHQTPISPGYSGGPLLDNQGVVVGLSTAINKETNGISYGVAAPDLSRLLEACALPASTAHLRRYSSIPVKGAVPTNAVIHPRPRQPSPDQIMLERGHHLLTQGDIAGARAAFEYAARKHATAEAYSALAKTYDPVVLGRLNVIGGMGDPARADELYAKARTLIEAAQPAKPAAGGCGNSLCVMIDGGGGLPLVMCHQAQASR